MNEQELLNNGIGRRLSFFGRAADMISITLSATEAYPFEFAVHIMTDAVVFYKGKLLTGTDDIYSFDDTHGGSKYDEKVSVLLNNGKDFVLQRISYDVDNCLTLVFDNQLEIRTIQECGFEPEDELWRILIPWRSEPHLVAKHSGVELEQSECSQEEIDQIRLSLSKRRSKRKRTV